MIAASSLVVSPFVRRAMMNAAAWMSVTRPSKISVSAASTSSSERSDRRDSLPSTPAMVSFTRPVPRNSIPPQVVVQNAAGDEAELDLRRPFDDRQLLRVAVVQLGQVLGHVAGRAEHLERLAGRLHGDFGRVVLRHRQE